MAKAVVDFEQDQVTYPRDVFGTFRGRWLKVKEGHFLSRARLVMKHYGVVVYQIRPKDHSREKYADKSVVEVEGELILRQGQYITDYDLRLSFEGVYIPKTGKFHVIIQPSNRHQQQIEPDKVVSQESRQNTVREAAPNRHNRVKVGFQGSLLKQCEFRWDMTAGELEDMLVLVQNPVVITDDEVDWGQIQTTDGREKLGQGIYMEGRFYSPDCHLDLLINGRTFYIQQNVNL